MKFSGKGDLEGNSKPRVKSNIVSDPLFWKAIDLAWFQASQTIACEWKNDFFKGLLKHDLQVNV